MGLYNDYYSDYGSGSSTGSSSWPSQQNHRWSSYQPLQTMEHPPHKSSSYSDLVTGRCTLEDVMRDFQMNGSDSPYNPDEDRIWGKNSDLQLAGMGPSSAYVRQKSWPAPERSPAPRLPRPEPVFTTSTPIFDESPAPFAPEVPALALAAFPPAPPSAFPPAPRSAFPPAPPSAFPPAPPSAAASLTAEQARVLASLPDTVLQSLLRQMYQDKKNKAFQECRFCKNNGERDSYYRGHVLKDGAGRVQCPVLRAFVCARCGARGDDAHTIKYCPLSTTEERIKSAAMMRSVRMASGRRRSVAGPLPPASAPEYVVFGATPPSLFQGSDLYAEVPLDPRWAALEQKLML